MAPETKVPVAQHNILGKLENIPKIHIDVLYKMRNVKYRNISINIPWNETPYVFIKSYFMHETSDLIIQLVR